MQTDIYAQEGKRNLHPGVFPTGAKIPLHDFFSIAFFPEQMGRGGKEEGEQRKEILV
jgi:hypothetical protein